MWRVLLLVGAVSLPSVACGRSPTGSSNGSSMAATCATAVSAMEAVQPGIVPDELVETGVKKGTEFDVNEYFRALPHLSMRDGYVLDWVYEGDSMGGYPVLYARPADVPPYTQLSDVPAAMWSADFRDFVEVDDSEQGYMEYVVFDRLADNFYPFWHAAYGYAVLCDPATAAAALEAGAMCEVPGSVTREALTGREATVDLAPDAATVRIVVFGDMFGFVQKTYAVSRQRPHTIDEVGDEPVEPYDCGYVI